MYETITFNGIVAGCIIATVIGYFVWCIVKPVSNDEDIF